MTRSFALLGAIATILFVMPGQCSVNRVALGSFAFPTNVRSLLVLVDRLPGKDAFARENAEQVAVALRYFTPNTTWDYIDHATPEQAQRADAVVYVGIDGDKWLKPPQVNVLRHARRLIVSEHHLRQVRAEKIAFLHTDGAHSVHMPADTSVLYRGTRAPITLDEVIQFGVHKPARTLATYSSGAFSQADIIVDGNAMFINSPLWFDSIEDLHPQMLAACDAIAAFISAKPNRKPLAMLRLEDVSVLTPPDRLKAIVTYLADVRAPYGIGVIPDLRLRRGGGGVLASRPDLVRVLSWAQGHGATIILHGLHHCCSSEDAEGYEFWDFDHKRAKPDDSIPWMRRQITEGLIDDAYVGLRPAMWETPHYAASPLDYRVISRFFPVSWELRDPTGWLPWPLQRDQYGSVIVPENLGYVALDGSKTVNDQLSIAREMLVCHYCVAVGFLHPSVLDTSVVRDYVQGLREMGYSFVDPKEFIPR